MSKPDQINTIRDGRIHIGFGRYYHAADDLDEVIFYRENLYAAVLKDSPIFTGEGVTLAELSQSPLFLYPAADPPSIADFKTYIPRTYIVSARNKPSVLSNFLDVLDAEITTHGR